MKKIIRLFSFLIAFFLGGVIFSFKVSASAPMPTLDPSTVQLVEVASELFNSMMFTEHYLSPISSDSFNANFNFGSLPYTDLWNWEDEDFTLSELSFAQKSELLNGVQDGIFDSDSQLTTNDSIYLVEYDNGFFCGNAYVNGDGEILYIGSSLGDQLLQIALGGNIYDADEMIANYEDLATDVNANGFNLPSDLITVFTPTNHTLFYCLGYKVSNSDRRLVQVYIPDAYNGNYYVEDKYGYPLNLYWQGTFGTVLKKLNRNVWIFNTSQNQTYKGVTYDRVATMPTISSFQSVNAISVNEYLNSNIPNGWYLIDYNNFHWDSNFASYDTDEYIPFSRVDKQLLNPKGTYSLEDLQEAVNTISTTVPTVNPDYDPNNNISPINYPQEKVLPDDYTVSESTLPLPNPSPNPGPSPFPDSDPSTNPTITNPYEQIDPTAITNNIPFITGLQNKFPFSIPWDIYNLVNGLSVPRETPVLDYEIEFPVINYTWEISIDLSMYDSIASLFRTLFLITFIIGLAVFSYNHFFGT